MKKRVSNIITFFVIIDLFLDLMGSAVFIVLGIINFNIFLIFLGLSLGVLWKVSSLITLKVLNYIEELKQEKKITRIKYILILMLILMIEQTKKNILIIVIIVI